MRRANVPPLRIPQSRGVGKLTRFFVLILAACSIGSAKSGTGSAFDRPEPEFNPGHYLGPAFIVGAIILAALIGWFLCTFTGPLESDPRRGTRNELEIKKMVTFCYVFTALSFLATAVPLALVLLIPQTGGASDQLYLAMAQSPIGLVLGCVHAPKDETWELACKSDQYRYQWILNIGGSAFFVPEFEKPSPASSVSTTPTTPATTRTATTTPTPVPGAIPISSPQASGDQTYQENSLDPYARWLPVVIHGGLSVPWFVLIVSIMGGAVSMARRVPEYQRRALDTSYDSLSPAKAREELVFQIVQVVSAPLIAITAYNVLTPESRAGTVALAFTSGFSSEAILMAIRSFSDHLIGTEKPAASQPTAGQPAAPLDWLNRLTIGLGEAAVSALKGEGPTQPPTG